MGPKRARSAPYCYNPDLPENWTSAQLKESLKSRGISFPANARRSVLIRLHTDNTASARSHNATENLHNDRDLPRSHNATDQNSNGDDRQNNVLIDIVSKLTSTVQSLQQNVINLTSRVNSLTPGAVSQSVSHAVVNNAQGQERLCTAGTSSVATDNYTLDTAFARISTAAAGSADQIPEFKRTKYGFSAESLPLVETISPQLRQQITSDEEIPNACARGRFDTNSLPTSFRVAKELKDHLEHLWDSSLCSSTRRTYSSALQCFLSFVCMSGITFLSNCLPVVNESLLVYFVTHCKSVLKLKYETSYI
ncbi:uncharacterized protein LOC130052607 [Ostrea edulis]|uniref:uncharacterized protein LOC130052607 n=1 Tax=Ostrea edulis TaxID=37623 RepID=UPI0024AFD1AF|nr:uncharacterized protein LOC130052607 [Ostrea edulis]